MTKDSRRAVRKRTKIKAWIRPDGGFSVRPCLVTDFSEAGARHVVEEPQKVSGSLVLLMTRDARRGYRCRVRWRRGREIGAAFTAAA